VVPSTDTDLSEQHPREQGLKLGISDFGQRSSEHLSEQHPREQGLKPCRWGAVVSRMNFQSNIQENKD